VKYVAMLASCFMLVSCLTYSSTLKIEAKCYSETSVGFQRTTRRCIQDDRAHNHGCENFKSYRSMIPMYKGWARNPALAPRPSMIYRAYDTYVTFILTREDKIRSSRYGETLLI
jgi:hypothetical protein